MPSSVCGRLHGLFTTSKTTTTLPKRGKTLKPATSLPKTPATATATATATPTVPNNSPPDSSDSSKEKKLKTLVRKFKKASDSDRFRHRSHKAYENTVRSLAAAQKFSYIEDILEHQKQYEEITTEGFTVRLISLYGKCGMFDHALKVFDEMPQVNCERGVKSFNALLSACVNSKKFDKIGDLLKELPEKLSIKPDNVSYNTVIKAFCEMGSFDSALSVIDQMEKNGLEPDLITFNTLLHAFYRNDRFSDGEKVWTLMEDKNIFPNVRSYNPKLRALVADNRISEAVDLIEEMRSNEVQPDVFSFNALIKGFCDDGNLEETKRWYEEMVKSDCIPDRVTFAMLGNLACDKGDFDFALKLCKEVISQRCLVDTWMMQRLVDGLVKESRMEEAKELVELGKSNNYCRYNLKIPTDE